jgi:hypothetical protein
VILENIVGIRVVQMFFLTRAKNSFPVRRKGQETPLGIIFETS